MTEKLRDSTFFWRFLSMSKSFRLTGYLKSNKMIIKVKLSRTANSRTMYKHSCWVSANIFDIKMSPISSWWCKKKERHITMTKCWLCYCEKNILIRSDDPIPSGLNKYSTSISVILYFRYSIFTLFLHFPIQISISLCF